ncbi:P-loop containing nucleoside triphosphate hydrolase protein [Hesseltinella vesiculosa]|uniref:RNA helicase n=1 Tax=Hesseltinella vesiculosa TaxID=101127 RepID=A0A1X2GR06_9FUNG|nr:P-loop containing nucleoside triphosphate hydrolase protein [Hesseltinella vesiculosa]
MQPALRGKRYYTTFQSIGIHASICNRIKSAFGFEQPTATQQQLIAAMLSGQDILLRDATGTGKSFGLAVALANNVHNHHKLPAMYITPNQELAVQVQRWLDVLAPTSASQVKIGTAGQIMRDHKEQPLMPHCIILDEADQAFRLPKRYASVRDQLMRQKHPKPAQLLLESIMPIHSSPPQPKPQLVVASATLNRPLRHWLIRDRKWMQHPTFIDTTQGSVQSPTSPVQHHCLLLDDDAIRNISPVDLFEFANPRKSQRQQSPANEGTNASVIDDQIIGSLSVLIEEEQPTMKDAIVFVDASTSNLDIQQRLDIDSQAFTVKDIRDAFSTPTFTSHDSSSSPSASPSTDRASHHTLWIANEFSARGIDLPRVSHVFILGKPSSVTGYLHMAGRTGRLGSDGQPRPGKVISLVPNHGYTEAKLVQMYKLMQIPVTPLPYVE